MRTINKLGDNAFEVKKEVKRNLRLFYFIYLCTNSSVFIVTMRPKYIFLLLLLSFYMSNCSVSEKNKEQRSTLEHQSIHVKELFIGQGGFLIPYKDMIIGMEASHSLPPFFCLKPDETSPFFYHFGNRGQGPNNFLHPFSIQLIHDNIIKKGFQF